tara:strand:+ start:590 stop:1486 length:897 start_codon:yes stop_codon:yes gene_type:complete
MSYLALQLVKKLEHPDRDEDPFKTADEKTLPRADVQIMAEALIKKVRGYKIAPKNRNSMWVYRPQDTYAMGWISLHPNTTGLLHAVYSPNIHNGRYSYGDKCFMSSALHLKKGLLNACKYLRPLNTKQVLQQVQGKFCNAVHIARQDGEDRANKIINKVNTDVFRRTRLNRSPLNRELANILRSDYEFADKELEAQLIEAFEAVKEQEESMTLHGVDHTFIEVIQSQGANLYRGFNTVKQNSSLFRHDCSDGNKVSYTQEELPEKLLGAISVLSMVEEGQYVSGVGYRAGANMFHVKC